MIGFKKIRAPKKMAPVDNEIIDKFMDDVSRALEDIIRTLVNQESIPTCWAHIDASGGTPVLTDNHGVASVADNGVGLYTLTWDIAFANATYAVVGTVDGAANEGYIVTTRAIATTTAQISVNKHDGTQADLDNITVIAMGDR